MTNQELKAKIDRVIETLEGIEASLAALVERQIEEREEREIARELVLHAQALAAPRVAPTWPWTPETVTQGFLASRWLRRDGTVYGGGALGRTTQAANSPIAGGDDAQAKVSVPSGVPRS